MKQLPPPPEPTSLDDFSPHFEPEVLQSVKLNDIHDESVVKRIAGKHLPALLATNVGIGFSYQAMITDRQLNIKGGWKSVYSNVLIDKSGDIAVEAIEGVTDSQEVRLEFGLNFGVESDLVSIGASLSKAIGRTTTLSQGVEIGSSQSIEVEEDTRIIVWQAYQVYEVVSNLKLIWSVEQRLSMPGFPISIPINRSKFSDVKTPLPPIQIVNTVSQFKPTRYPKKKTIEKLVLRHN